MPKRSDAGLRRILRPLLSGALAVVLAVVLLAAAVHVHHDLRGTDDCPLCAVAHTPAVQAAPAPSAALVFPGVLVRVASAPDRAPEAPGPFCVSARAPPTI